MDLIRRVDDLGRVTIPKEIRKELHITCGEPLLIVGNVINECIILSKYDKFKNLSPVKEYLDNFLNVNDCLLLKEEKEKILNLITLVQSINDEF